MIRPSVIIIIGAYYCFFHQASAQETIYSKNIIYFELLGAGNTYSANYERVFKSNQSFRAGFGWFPGDWRVEGVNDKTYIYTPLTYQYLVGKHRHKLELQGGLLGTWSLNRSLPDQYKLTPQLGLGYRFQPARKFFARVGMQCFTPLFLNIDKDEIFLYTGKHFYLWPGVSAGWLF